VFLLDKRVVKKITTKYFKRFTSMFSILSVNVICFQSKVCSYVT